MADLRFDGRVVVVTGAGAGLGKAYALLFASRGASVVVNDLGGGKSGDGSSSNAADGVVQEIRNNGGNAVADYNSVVNGEKIIQTALDNFGRVDIIVNNAGILRDRSFARISDKDWDLIQDVHLKGAFKVTQAAWPHLRKQNYGRVIVTSSNAGLCGNFGQANYSAAKMGLVGLCNTLAIEGRKNNINCNVIVPTAASRLTEGIIPPDLFAELKPELIAPVVVWLCHEQCQENGSIIESAAGWASKAYIKRNDGVLLRNKITEFVSPEAVRDKWNAVTDMSNTGYLPSIEENTMKLVSHLESLRANISNNGASSSSESHDIFKYTSKDSILYALGIGASVDAESDLQYLYEGHENFSAFPTFAIIPAIINIMSSEQAVTAIPGKTYDLSQVLHGEQYLEIFDKIPTEGCLKTTSSILDVVDKGKNAVIISKVDIKTEDERKIAYAEVATFVLGAGGFGGKSSSENSVPIQLPPKRKPDKSFSDKTSTDQAALYRLSGDLNPMHIDPNFALLAGYKKPILHGLCTLGFSIRHVLYLFAANNPELFKALKVRFAKPVTPGDTLKTDMWRVNNRIHFETSVEGKTVLAGGYVDLSEVNTGHNQITLRRINGTELASNIVFEGMREKINSDRSLLKRINAVFVYNITHNKNTVTTWTADLKNGDVYNAPPKEGLKPDVTLTIDDTDMVDMALGKLNPQAAFIKGKLKIKGNILQAQKLKLLMEDSKL